MLLWMAFPTLEEVRKFEKKAAEPEPAAGGGSIGASSSTPSPTAVPGSSGQVLGITLLRPPAPAAPALQLPVGTGASNAVPPAGRGQPGSVVSVSPSGQGGSGGGTSPNHVPGAGQNPFVPGDVCRPAGTTSDDRADTEPPSLPAKPRTPKRRDPHERLDIREDASSSHGDTAFPWGRWISFKIVIVIAGIALAVVFDRGFAIARSCERRSSRSTTIAEV